MPCKAFAGFHVVDEDAFALMRAVSSRRLTTPPMTCGAHAITSHSARRVHRACWRAAYSIALTMLWYPVQRQRVAFDAVRISLSWDCLFCSKSPTADMIIPGVQKPHWRPWRSQNPSWIGWRSPFWANPSMVLTVHPRPDRKHRQDLGSHRHQNVQAPHNRSHNDVSAGEIEVLAKKVAQESSVLNIARDNSPLTVSRHAKRPPPFVDTC